MTEAEVYVDPRRARTLAAIKAALPATKMQASASSGIHRATVMRLVSQMHEEGRVHIGRWQPHPVRGPNVPVYFDGPGEDVPDTLPRLTRKQISARYEKRIAGTEKQDKRRARQRTRHWEKKAKAAPKGWAAALGL
jgi:hypothetical protein